MPEILSDKRVGYGLRGVVLVEVTPHAHRFMRR
jgi:hypothetical protein